MIAIGVIAVLLLAIGGAVVGIKLAGEKAVDNWAKNAANNLAAGDEKSVSQSSSDDSYSEELSRDKAVGYGESYLATVRSKNIDDLRDMGFTVEPDYSEEASNEGLADSLFVDLYCAWKLGSINKAKGEKVLQSIIDPEGESSNDYARMSDAIGNGGSPILTKTSRVGDWTKNFYKSDYLDRDGNTFVESNGNAMRVLTVHLHDNPTETDAGAVNQIVFQQDNAVLPDGKESKKWVVKAMISTDDKNYVSDLRTVDATVS